MCMFHTPHTYSTNILTHTASSRPNHQQQHLYYHLLHLLLLSPRPYQHTDTTTLTLYRIFQCDSVCLCSCYCCFGCTLRILEMLIYCEGIFVLLCPLTQNAIHANVIKINRMNIKNREPVFYAKTDRHSGLRVNIILNKRKKYKK